MSARSQLRMYQIAPGKMAEFVREWRSGVVPLRKQFGFHLEGAWVVEGADTFVWIVRYDGDGGFADADATYYGSPERKALQPSPARHIVEQQTWMIEPAD
jgi:NIPSNAP protein